MEHDDVCNAINSFYKMASEGDDVDCCDIEDAEIASDLFKKAVRDYKRLIKTCEREGVSVLDETEDYKEAFGSSHSVGSRLTLIKNVRNEIKSMIDVCSSPPKDIISKYSEDLVSRIENGIIDDSFYAEE